MTASQCSLWQGEPHGRSSAGLGWEQEQSRDAAAFGGSLGSKILHVPHPCCLAGESAGLTRGTRDIPGWGCHTPLLWLLLRAVNSAAPC